MGAAFLLHICQYQLQLMTITDHTPSDGTLPRYISYCMDCLQFVVISRYCLSIVISKLVMIHGLTEQCGDKANLILLILTATHKCHFGPNCILYVSHKCTVLCQKMELKMGELWQYVLVQYNWIDEEIPMKSFPLTHS